MRIGQNIKIDYHKAVPPALGKLGLKLLLLTYIWPIDSKATNGAYYFKGVGLLGWEGKIALRSALLLYYCERRGLANLPI